MRGPRAAALLLACGAGACAHPTGPREAARAYLEALAAGDMAAAHALTAQAVRTSTPASALAVLPRDARPGDEDGVWTLVLADDRRLTLVREADGAWRVDDDALWARSVEDPRGAITSFFEAVAAGDLARVRAFLPEGGGASGRLASDEALTAHLAAQRDRLERARVALGDVARRTPIVEGDHAQLPYDGRRAIRLVREAGRWRVLDVE